MVGTSRGYGKCCLSKKGVWQLESRKHLGQAITLSGQNTLHLSKSQKHDAAFQWRWPQRGPPACFAWIFQVCHSVPCSCLNPALVFQGPPRVGVTLALPSCVAYPLQMPAGVMLQPAPGKGNEEMSNLTVAWGCWKTVPGTVDEIDEKLKWVEPVTLLFLCVCSGCVGEESAFISWCVSFTTCNKCFPLSAQTQISPSPCLSGTIFYVLKNLKALWCFRDKLISYSNKVQLSINLFDPILLLIKLPALLVQKCACTA